VMDLFREWDIDGDGTITRKEFLKAMPRLGLEVSKDAINQVRGLPDARCPAPLISTVFRAWPPRMPLIRPPFQSLLEPTQVHGSTPPAFIAPLGLL
jgi:hypothetical protein